jgi:hypothetical protein
MKKTALVLCAVLLCALFAVPAQAEAAESVGYAVYSDIIVKIDGYPIRSYFINDKVAIPVEDLSGYGFNVQKDGNGISVTHTEDPIPEGGWAEYAYNVPEELVGTRWIDVYASDAAVYVNGERVETLSADGETLIWMDSLACFGLIYMDSFSRVYELTFSETMHRTVDPVLSFVKIGNKVMVQSVEYAGEPVVVAMDAFGVKICNPAGLLDNESAQSNKYVTIVKALKAMGLPSISRGEATANTWAQRDEVSEYIVATLNGERVYGDLWWNEGVNGLEMNFTFTEPLQLKASDEFVFALDGTSAALH